MKLPNDPVILMSYLNTQLRDRSLTLEEYCEDCELNADKITKKLEAAGFRYDAERRRFR